jgi:hypothetical protein
VGWFPPPLQGLKPYHPLRREEDKNISQVERGSDRREKMSSMSIQ